MIQLHGYPFEKHLIETEDGYFIEVHRIPGGKNEKINRTLINKPPVYLLHALTQSSADWIAVGPRISLGKTNCVLIKILQKILKMKKTYDISFSVKSFFIG